MLEVLEARDCPSCGLLDPTFNDTGEKVLSSSVMQIGADANNVVAVQADGKIVGVGTVATSSLHAIQVVRMNPDGTLDSTFNGTGMVTISVGPSASGEAVALQPDGKILVGGRTYVKGGTEDVVARLNADGSLDTTFGNTGRKGGGSGVWTSNLASASYVRDLTVLTDSSNNLTGIMVGGQHNGSFEAIKLTPAGQMDTTFGVGGDAVVSVGGVQHVGGMAVTPSRGVFMVGDAGQFGEIVALTPTGQLDTTFNGTGYRVDSFSDQPNIPLTYFDAVTVQPTAGGGYRLIVSGATYMASTPHGRSGLVVAYTSSGQLDSTFATGGLFITPDATEFTRVQLEADDSIALAGWAFYTDPNGDDRQQVAVGHLSADGAADTTFGTAGTGISLLTPLDPSNGENPYGMAIDPAGRIVVSFFTDGNTGFARFTAP
jgi:uncharacterized delta-60 repeat protein